VTGGVQGRRSCDTKPFTTPLGFHVMARSFEPLRLQLDTATELSSDPDRQNQNWNVRARPRAQQTSRRQEKASHQSEKANDTWGDPLLNKVGGALGGSTKR
jgi:hypothetical protein